MYKFINFVVVSKVSPENTSLNQFYTIIVTDSELTAAVKIKTVSWQVNLNSRIINFF